MEKCIACGLCSEKCPKKVRNEYDGGLCDRKAIYVKYVQAVPLKYAIDDTQCLFLTKGKCKLCEKTCPTGAIRYDDTPREMTLKVGAVIMANGCETYNPKAHDAYGYGKSPNIVTSLEFERILSASGPYGGHLVRPSDKKEPKKSPGCSASAPGPAYRRQGVLLIGLLHLCDQRGRAGQGAQQGAARYRYILYGYPHPWERF